MKYFGEKSISSVMSIILNISWVLSIIACVIAPLFMAFILFYSTPSGEAFFKSAAQKYSSNELNEDFSEKDREDWTKFKSLPLPVKCLIIPYIGSILVLLLLIIGKSRKLFANFKNSQVFNINNVHLIANIAKLLIPFSIVTFTFSTLLVSIVLLLLCEIIKDGTVLKEEMELTI